MADSRPAETAGSLAEANLDRVAQIDRSVRSPVALLAGFSVLWLALGSLLALVASVKLHLPEFMNTECLTYGRVRALQSVALGYGWSFNAALAVGLWLMHRLGRVELRQGWVAVLGALAWNLALAQGALSVAGGRMTGVEWLELPREVGPVLAVAFLLVGLWAAVAFSRRQTGHVYVSQWYVVAAMFWLPVVYLAAQLAFQWYPARGTVQAVVDGWHAHGVTTLFLGSVGLASLYYFIPKVLARPVHSYYLAVVGFWTFVIFGGWSGLGGLVGGPIPVWLQSVSVVAAAMLAIPVLIVAINLLGTLARGGVGSAWREPALRFSAFGAVNFVLAGLVGAVMPLRGLSAVTRFTEFMTGHAHHVSHAFLAMTLFGALYFILPRLARREWPSASLVSAHFWLCAVGTVGYVAVTGIHGWIQGQQWNAAVLTPAQIAAAGQPWHAAATGCVALLAVGHLVFAAHVLWLLAPRADRNGAQPSVAR